ncbi:LysR family transcriptional regulator [Bradyrhizobium sp. U87765 SZCCT0131]|uniref:LysR substrate-binding domain-containing protein n=1 Tax=unclassified Bradyrhizobium TaxID=2631580 RepID=UPI001BA88D5E|nr:MULTISPECIES: LysR family transcriptional regulator [unclassified Bradyrhizobium]MBR1220857.1 LysR family transcriptional regulator [Bradyrhizobium sp. U87765 SZCCT0131]MBR1260323.1 LysR family transcriptional regulator [Bradyrhizobium sp. U87765 SZCCT0134]MBR1307428.1 LysR family transcriptional regulator [Bradyrhizobium sp. U87765 SZCCT0110]MBR1321382.1 LysR family transcriptional regulator [Bradyrhizobium sp. U87765 SZCCT0109]MBR1349695.1 LysR family transcriptional regulator [Bradyrhizo
MLELQQLRYFVAVAETESVVRAERALNLTQSPLSRQIQGLEAQLGLTLFYRSKKRLKLTATGRDFLTEAKALLAHSATLERRARALTAGSEGSLVVGYVEGAVHSGSLANALRSFRRAAPRAEIELRRLRSPDQFQQLQAREIDIGFAYSAPPTGAGLRSRMVCKEPFRLAFPRDRGWTTPPSASRISAEAFIALPASASPSGRRAMIEACEAAGIKPNIRYEAADPLTVLEMVGASLGVAIVQAGLERIKPANVSFARMPRGFAMAMTVHLICAEDRTPLADTFFNTLEVPPGRRAEFASRIALE